MATVHDIAEFIRRELGTVNAVKLHKLCFYVQGWSLVWHGEPLFSEGFEAWRMGPVCAELYQREKYGTPGGSPSTLSPREAASVRAVLDAYGRFDSSQLIAITHSEAPWRAAYQPNIHGRCDRPIALESMRAYFKTMDEGTERVPAKYLNGCTMILGVPEAEVGLLAKDAVPVSEDDVSNWLDGGPAPWERALGRSG